MEKSLGLYIHVPFCIKKCDYCDFLSFPMSLSVQKQYLQALKREIHLYNGLLKGKTFDSIFIGGGTPSAVYSGFIKELVKTLRRSFKIDSDVEFTIELNPHSLSREKLKEYLSVGINRFSIGVQSISEDVLKAVNRLQTKADIDRAFELLKEYNVENINADIMLGLPKETFKSVRETSNYLINHGVKHVSMYSLQLEERTPLYNKVKNGDEHVLSDDDVLKMYNEECSHLAENGIFRYEVSNFAMPGYECRHNLKYWNSTEYLGLGLGASGYIEGVRYTNTNSLSEYLSNFNVLFQNAKDFEGKDIPAKILDSAPFKLPANQKYKFPISYFEKLTKDQKCTEYIMLHLRTREGINLTEFKQSFNRDLLTEKQSEISNLIQNKYLIIENDHLKLSQGAYYVSNQIILALID